MNDKALGLLALGRVQEAKTTLESGLRQPAITEYDDTSKQTMRRLLAEINAQLKTMAPTKQMSPARTSSNTGKSATVTGGVQCNGIGGGFSLDIVGEIDSATVEKVKKLFDEYHETLRKRKGGVIKCDMLGPHYGINSTGGSVSAAMAIGRMFRKERAWIMIPDGGVCISACVLVLAGAVERGIRGSRVGIHRPYLGTTPQRMMTADQVKEAYKTMLASVRAYLREMNVSESLANDMLAVEPEKVHMLPDAELKDYGLLGIDAGEQQRRAIEQEVRDVSAANQRGLEHREYTRRKALIISVCGPAVLDVEWRARTEACAKRVMETGQ
jgi:ATP-dependent protease ClpP protease subunit